MRSKLTTSLIAVLAVSAASLIAGCGQQQASLNQEMADRRAGSKAPADKKAVMAESARKLEQSGIAAKALGVSEAFPDFTLPDSKGRAVKLSTLRSLGPVVVTFYRGGWCPYCNMELRAYEERLADIRAAGGTLVAVSPEKPTHAEQTAAKGGLSYPLLFDRNNTLAGRLGLVFGIDPALKEVYQGYGIDLSESQGNEAWALPIPATYVIDPSGKVVFAHVETDYTRRAEPGGVVEVLRKLKGAKE